MKCKTCEDRQKLARMLNILRKIDDVTGIGVTCLACNAVIVEESTCKKFTKGYIKLEDK